MTTPSVSKVSDVLDMVDGVVIGPVWTDDRSRELLRLLRMTTAAPDDPDAEECPADVRVAARLFHEVLSLIPAAARLPLFAAARSGGSLFKHAVLHAHADADLAALVRLCPESALAAANVARWLLQLPQQRSVTMTFADPPRIAVVHRPPGREVAVAC